MQDMVKTAFLATWTVVGLFIIGLFIMGIFGSGTWVENLNLTEQTDSSSQSARQPQQQPQQPQAQQPPQPTEEQLACISEEVGEERLAELQEGAAAEEGENQVIQSCLTE